MIRAVVEQRAVKEQQEIVEIEKAVNTTVEMHRAAMRFAQPGMRESEVAALVANIALAENGNLSFPIIATINGQTLHNHHHGNLIKKGDLFLLDAGAETSLGYAGDNEQHLPYFQNIHHSPKRGIPSCPKCAYGRRKRAKAGHGVQGSTSAGC